MDPLEHYWKFAESEQRFNSSQAGIRTLASGWLLAAAAAIGILLRSESEIAWLVPRSVLVVLVCSLAAAGFATLWVMDQLVFQRLLNAVFLVGLKLEADNPTLPPIRAMMMMSAERKGMHRWLRFFYVVPMLAFLIVSIVVTVRPVETSASPYTGQGGRWLLALSVALLVIQVAILGWVAVKQSAIDFKTRARAFGDHSFDEIVEKGAYDVIINRYRGRTVKENPEAASQLTSG